MPFHLGANAGMRRESGELLKPTIYLSSNTTGGEESGLDSLISAGFRMVLVSSHQKEAFT